MAKATVKWFSDPKGFGFLEDSTAGGDVFVHHSEIQMRGRRTLQEGQTVEYELSRGPKGLCAKNVRPQ